MVASIILLDALARNREVGRFQEEVAVGVAFVFTFDLNVNKAYTKTTETEINATCA